MWGLHISGEASPYVASPHRGMYRTQGTSQQDLFFAYIGLILQISSRVETRELGEIRDLKTARKVRPAGKQLLEWRGRVGDQRKAKHESAISTTEKNDPWMVGFVVGTVKEKEREGVEAGDVIISASLGKAISLIVCLCWHEQDRGMTHPLRRKQKVPPSF